MKRLCSECGKRPPKFISKFDSRIRTDKKHDLCYQCVKKY